MEKKERIRYWDFVKGIAIFLVVWGHTIQFGGRDIAGLFENKAFIFIYSFHMPLFILMSGYFLAKSVSKRSFLQNLKKKLTHIVVPAILGGVVFFIIKTVFERLLGNSGYPLSLAAVLREIEAMWFLWTVFMCSVAVMISDRLGGKRFSWVLMCVCFAAFLFLPYSDYNIYLFPYFVTGYYMEKSQPENMKLPEIFSLLLFPLLLQYYGEQHFIYSTGVSLSASAYGAAGQACINIFRWVIGFAGCFVAILFARKLDEAYPDSKIISVFREFGKYTLEIYILQRIVVEYLGAKVLWKIVNGMGLTWLGGENVYNYLFTPVCAVVYTFVMYLMAKGLEKIMNRLKRGK